MGEGARRTAAAGPAVPESGRDVVAPLLRSIGVPNHGARLVLTLAGVGAATAGELIARTGIPDSKIYYALDDLVERGLVEFQQGRPRTFRLVRTRELARRLSHHLDTEYERRRAELLRLADALEPIRSPPSDAPYEVAYVVKGPSQVRERARTLIESARRDLVLMSADAAFLETMVPELRRAQRRGVRLRLAVSKPALPSDLRRAALLRSIVCECTILVTDDRHAFTVHHSSQPDAYGISSADETLVRLSRDYWDSPRCCRECS